MNTRANPLKTITRASTTGFLGCVFLARPKTQPLIGGAAVGGGETFTRRRLSNLGKQDARGGEIAPTHTFGEGPHRRLLPRAVLALTHQRGPSPKVFSRNQSNQAPATVRGR